MKVEAAKNNPVEKKDPKNVYKTETSVFNTDHSLRASQPPTTGAFAKILEETRHHKSESASAKTADADADAAPAKTGKEEKVSRVTDEKKETGEHGERSGDGDASQNGDENLSGQTVLAALFNSGITTEINAPAARSIMHVADLERIVATIRTETFQNQKQLIIALKNSVLQGLQIKLILTENGKVKAEFLAANEHIKKQLKQRRHELAGILGNRSSLFSEIDIALQEPAL